jgi:hypothetical protein
MFPDLLHILTGISARKSANDSIKAPFMEIPPIVTDEMRTYFRTHYDTSSTNSLEDILIKLKSKGYSQMQSVFLLVDELKIAFGEANQVILNSKAWS